VAAMAASFLSRGSENKAQKNHNYGNLASKDTTL
jgi:hypothetical protein